MLANAVNILTSSAISTQPCCIVFYDSDVVSVFDICVGYLRVMRVVRFTRRITMKSFICTKAIAFIILMYAASTAFAAPYCAVFSYGKQCYYYDWSTCQQAAGTQGACVINQEEAKAPSGGAPFCVVASYGTQCYYYDAQACRQAAASANAVCATNPNR